MQEDKEKEMTKDVVVSLKGLQLAPDQQLQQAVWQQSS